MLRTIFIICTLFTFGSVFPQSDFGYFPQEQILIPACESNSNKSECFYEYLKNQVITFITDKKRVKQFLKYDKDTLKVGARLVYGLNNDIISEKSFVAIQDKKLGNKYNEDLKDVFYTIDISQIQNRKPLASIHAFSFDFLIDKNGETIAYKHIKNKNVYSGGEVHEIPRFPGCEELSEQQARTCFQEKMQNHIKANFNYPKLAMEKGISGTVYIIFDINRDGKIENIRLNGEYILKEEALRIIKLLPNMSPGMVNGEPVKVPYSIPMHFRL